MGIDGYGFTQLRIFHGEATAGLEGFDLGPGDFVSGRADAEQSETWTIHDPNGAHAAGTPGLYQLTFTVSGASSIAVGLDGEADAGLAIGATYDGPVFFGGMGTGEIHGSGQYSLDSPIKFQYDVPFSVSILYDVFRMAVVTSMRSLFS
jgi:hypothetical protein